MERRSPRCPPAIAEKDQMGCMWGLFSLFHFNQARLNQKKLISHPPHQNKNVTGTGYPRSRASMLADLDDNCEGINNGMHHKAITGYGGERSIKNLIGNEISSSSNVQIKNSKKARKKLEISSNKLILAAMLEAFCNQINEENGTHNLNRDQINEISLHMSTEAIIDQMFLDRKFLKKLGRSHNQSRQFNNAMDTLNSNKEFFTKILQDSNSRLVKQIQGLETKKGSRRRLPEIKFSECGISFPGKVQHPVHSMDIDKKTTRKSIWKKIKSQYGCRLKGGINDCHSNRIVVLKPGQKKDLKPIIKPEISAISTSKRKEFDVFLEAKRHLSERLKNMNKGENLSTKQAPRTLRRILSSPEHDFLLPILSPRKDRNKDSTLMRFSPYSNCQKEKEMSCPSPVRQSEVVPQCTDLSSKGNLTITETDDIIRSEESSSPEMSSKESGCLDGKTMEPPSENQYLESPLNPLSIYPQVEVMDNSKDREEQPCQPSPISVLEPAFLDDVSSPTSSIAHPGGSLLMQPHKIDFEDQALEISPINPKIDLRSCLEDQNPTSAFIKAVLQASGLNWNELWFLSEEDQLLNPFLFDELEYLFPAESYYDLRVFFDCINEGLMKVYQRYFKCTCWLLFVKRGIQHISKVEEKMINEVIKEVNRYLLPPTTPRTLDQTVGKDIAQPENWSDLRLDTEEIVLQIAEDILEELIMETNFGDT